MAGYNLNQRQRQIVQELVRVHRDGYDREFLFAAMVGSNDAISFDSTS